MRDFYIKITKSDSGKQMYNIEFWYCTDLRYNTITSEIPVNEINKWLENNNA